MEINQRQLTECRSEEAKKQRKEHRKNKVDYCSRRGKILVPRADEQANCVTANQGKEGYIMETKPGKDISYCLDSNYHKGTNTTEKSRRKLVSETHTVAYSKSTRDNHIDHRGKVDGESNTLSTGDGCRSQSSQNFVTDTSYRIRKLTPVECERLMTWPDNWTKLGRLEDGKIYELSNSARYKACGNGIVSNIPKLILDKITEGREGLRVFSTFAGVDGSGMYLTEPKYVKVGFSEFDPKTKVQHPSNVLRYHYPEVINLGDITKIDPAQIPDHDIIFISAPCQSFSAAGKNLGLEDTRGTLFYETARIMKDKKPDYFIFENVANLLSKKHSGTFETMCEVYSELGYELDFELINAKHYGAAQNRERIFMVGRRIK